MSADTAPATLSPETVAKIEREKIRLAFGTWVQYVDGVPFAIGLATLMSGLWPTLGDAGAIPAALWAGAAVLWSICTSLTFQYYQKNEERHATDFWLHVQLAMCTSHGLIWGGFAWVFWQSANSVNQAILCTVTLGIIVGTFFSLAMHRRLLVAALATHTAVQWSAFVYYGEPLARVFMIVFPLFVAVLLNYGRTAARRYHSALQLRFENEAMAEALRRANRAKSDFLASMSHDLRTPLNAIIGYADLIRQGTFGPIAPKRYAEFVEDISSSSAHLLKMINDLLDLAKIEAGKREYHFVPLRLSETAKEALRFVEPQASQAHVDLLLDIKHDAHVRADERAVKQMIVNLLSNAVKFSRPGGIAVLFCDLTLSGRVAFGVKDTGVGMTPEMQAKALEPFAQAGDMQTVEGSGTGLGLPIVKNLIEAHQGELRIESNAGVGSKIWIEFPADRLIRKADAA